MYCPSCRAEFCAGHKECSECGVQLVDELPAGPKLEYVDLHTVLVAPNETVLMVAKSRLEAEGITCCTTNNVQDLFGVGRITGYNLVTGPQELQVVAGDAKEAKRILDAVMNQEQTME